MSVIFRSETDTQIRPRLHLLWLVRRDSSLPGDPSLMPTIQVD